MNPLLKRVAAPALVTLLLAAGCNGGATIESVCTKRAVANCPNEPPMGVCVQTSIGAQGACASAGRGEPPRLRRPGRGRRRRRRGPRRGRCCGDLGLKPARSSLYEAAPRALPCDFRCDENFPRGPLWCLTAPRIVAASRSTPVA